MTSSSDKQLAAPEEGGRSRRWPHWSSLRRWNAAVASTLITTSPVALPAFTAVLLVGLLPMSAGASTRPTVSDMEDGVSPTGGSVSSPVGKGTRAVAADQRGGGKVIRGSSKLPLLPLRYASVGEGEGTFTWPIILTRQPSADVTVTYIADRAIYSSLTSYQPRWIRTTR